MTVIKKIPTSDADNKIHSGFVGKVIFFLLQAAVEYGAVKRTEPIVSYSSGKRAGRNLLVLKFLATE